MTIDLVNNIGSGWIVALGTQPDCTTLSVGGLNIPSWWVAHLWSVFKQRLGVYGLEQIDMCQRRGVEGGGDDWGRCSTHTQTHKLRGMWCPFDWWSRCLGWVLSAIFYPPFTSDIRSPLIPSALPRSDFYTATIYDLIYCISVWNPCVKMKLHWI